MLEIVGLLVGVAVGLLFLSLIHICRKRRAFVIKYLPGLNGTDQIEL